MRRSLTTRAALAMLFCMLAACTHDFGVYEPSNEGGPASATDASGDANRIDAATDAPQAEGGADAASPCLTAAGFFANRSFGARSGTFTAEADVTPLAIRIDAAFGLSLGPQTIFTGLAAIVLFDTTGKITARDGASYSAGMAIPYNLNTVYHVRMVVDVVAKTYSSYVKPQGQPEVQIGMDYAFRTEQQSVASLDNFAVGGDPGSGAITACNMIIR